MRRWERSPGPGLRTASSLPLKEKLQALQCHFTWDFEIRDKVDAVHILHTVALRIAHTPYPNQAAYLALQAYLCHLQGRYEDALQSLREAEEFLARDHPGNVPRQALVIYGNYAWIYYHLAHYDVVERYLDQVSQICRSLNSRSPYAALIPEVHAHKGWSLLATGFRNGQEASKCFQRALAEDEANGEFLAGSAIAAFASYTHSRDFEYKSDAKKKLSAIIQEEPQNYEAKMYLAKILERRDRPQAEALVEDVVRNSRDPEVLRNAAKFFQGEFPEKAIAILERAISLDPTYHLPHYDLARCYKEQLAVADTGRREEILAAATEAFKMAVQKDPAFVFAKLALAEMYGEKTPEYQEEIYLNLLSKVSTLSKKCQQAVYLHWGDFLLYTRESLPEAAEIYKAGFVIAGTTREKETLRNRLQEVADVFRQRSQTTEAAAIQHVLERYGSPWYKKKSTRGRSRRLSM
ncbi:interferon-induced protein with tetratricopeptide repeats 5-like isoform X1 [Pelodiscus sinensis]|uniref:interferon-induced protein with tetratricopeptide repeats 5-like isoform X1 n=1 Tax=Pelodiscus sinensis TaxID=13735 RepID=UPI003F6C2E51